MEDYRLDQSGQEVQDILNGAAMQVDLTAETERATEAEQTLQGNIDAEATRAQGAEGTLQDNIDAEEARAKAAEKQNADDIDAIEEKIPSGASSSNKLATEEYVADAVATATATFRGTYNLVSDLHLTVNATEQQIAAALAGAISTADNNDYCFILVPTSSETPTEIKEIDRYKFNGTAWAFEYKLNNSGFTAAQWAAINSGITSGDVTKLSAMPTNAQLTTLLAGLQADIDGEETRAKAAELAIQGNIDAEEVRAKAAEKQNADDIDAIEAVLPESASSENKVATESEINSLSAAIEAILLLIPSAATSLNKLADKAFVNSSIATATATFRGTYNLVNDLGLTTSATHAQIATALAGAILTADNNDYAFVQIPTSDAMPTEIAKTERYKFNGTAWEYEYDLNNSGFTADQWAAINSGITQALVTKLSALPTNAELTTELGTLTSGINTINQKIPNAASQANKLVDTAAMESYIVQVLDVLTASFNVTSTDGHVTVQISQVDGKITSVAVSTSDIASAADLNLKASKADLTALASRVTTAEGNITTLGGRITTAEGNITSLGGRMTTAEGNITTINGIITSLGGRVSTNETDIANLQELYNSLQQSKPVPVDALPETGQQQGVIYRLSGTTSYSDYMWNGSTWVLMATYNNAIDPRPKKASQNLVTSGGVFDNMGALDVSELNATENPHTLAQYTDLSAALAAIPTDYQKGGMSIKFVQSSDNKYIQYRLKAQTFTTNITEWIAYKQLTLDTLNIILDTRVGAVPVLIENFTYNDGQDDIANCVKVQLPSAPKQLAFIKNGLFTQVNYTETEIIVQPFYALVLDAENNSLVTINIGNWDFRNLINAEDKYAILFYNDNGYVKGEWAKYVIQAEFDSFKSLVLNTPDNDIHTRLTTVPHLIEKYTYNDGEEGSEDIANCIKVELPSSPKQMAMIYNGVFRQFNYTETEIIVQPFYGLFFNLETNTLLNVNIGAGTLPLVNYNKRIIMLFYNDSGYVKGEWEKYVRQAEIERIIYDSCLPVISPRTNTLAELSLVKSGTDIIVNLPTTIKQLQYIKNGKWDQINYTTTTITVPNGSALIINLNTKALEVVNVNQNYATPLPLVTYTYYVLFINDNGYPKGEWEKYYIYKELELNKHNTSTDYVIVSRQNELNGYPENSIVGLKEIYKKGYKAVRVSVRWTSDNIPVLEHDDDISRLARNADGTAIPSGTVYVSQSTYNELLNYDFGIARGSQFAGLKITKLEDYLSKASKLGMYVMMEMKKIDISTPAINATTGEILNNIIIKTGIVGNVGAFEGGALVTDMIDTLKAINPSIDLGWIPSENAMTTEAHKAYILSKCELCKTESNKAFMMLSGYAGEHSNPTYNDTIISLLSDTNFRASLENLNVRISLAGGVLMNKNEMLQNMTLGATWLEVANVEYPDYEIVQNELSN